MNPPAVSISIVNWNTREILRACLRSVYENAGTVDFHIIVVDNASTDGSAEMVREYFGRVQLIANPQNRGFAAANNQGIAVAKGRYVLLLNSDTIVLRAAIEKAVAFADAHPEVAIVGCRVLNPDYTLQRTCFMFPSLLNMLLSSTYLYKLWPRSRLFGREQLTWWDRNDVREVDVVTGCFMLVRRAAILQVGMMDDEFFMYGEETDWCYRFKKAGWKIMFAPHGEIVHLGGASSARAADEMTLQLKAGILQFMHKHYSRPTYIAACGLMELFLVSRIPYWLLRTVLTQRHRKLAWSRAIVYARGVWGVLGGWKGLRARLRLS